MSNAPSDPSITRAQKAGPQKRRIPKKATPERLEKAALFYLERFASSSENLRRVLMRRVDQSARHHGTDQEEGVAAINKIIQRFLRAGLLDDQAFAKARAESLHKRGTSLRAIRMKLSQKGVDSATIEQALEDLRQERALGEEADIDPDLHAAFRYAKRRRIGPYRLKDREASQAKDLAALGRQGFSYDVAKKVLETEDPGANDV